MSLSLAKMRSFISVAERGSFRQAAEAIHRSQPAISAHIRDLETELGICLLNRTTRTVRLTQEGEQVFRRVKRLVLEIDEMVLECKDEAALRRGRVAVACVPTVASSMLPLVLASFAESYPAIRVEIFDEVSELLYERVLNREADFAIGPLPPPNANLTFSSLGHDHFIAVFPHGHPLARNPVVGLAEFVRYPIVTLASNTNVRMILETTFAEQGYVLDPIYEPRHHYTLGGMVEAGLGVTALPSMSLSLLGHPRLKSATIVAPRITRNIGVLTRPDDTLSPAATVFRATVQKAFVKANGVDSGEDGP